MRNYTYYSNIETGCVDLEDGVVELIDESGRTDLPGIAFTRSENDIEIDADQLNALRDIETVSLSPTELVDLSFAIQEAIVEAVSL